MRTLRRRINDAMVTVLLISFSLCSLAGQNVSAAVGDTEKGPSEIEIKRITETMPTKPVTAPKTPRPKLLVFSRCWGYRHSAIPYGKITLEIMAAKTDAFEVVVCDDLSNFEPENIKNFDAIFFNNTNNEIFLPEPEDLSKLSSKEKTKAIKYDKLLKKSLTDYIASGGGFGALHAGSATFREWPEFGYILGATLQNHPWSNPGTVTLTVEEPAHPVAQAFRGPRFVVADEIYQFQAPYSRDLVRVLLSIDTEKTDMNKEEIRRTDNDFAISWVKSFGKGRVFYVALGHDHAMYWNRAFLEHLLAGLQFALGDLKADTTPSSKVNSHKLNQ